MITTAFMSMWISNTAATSMMIPIGQAVLVELVRARKRKPIGQEEADIGYTIKNKTDHSIGTVLKFKRMGEPAKSVPLTHINMATH